MANNKKVYTNVKIEQSVLINIAYLELSEDGGNTYEVIDQIIIPANSTPTVTDFDLMPSIDVDNPLIKVRVKVVPQTTTTTSTTSTTSSTTTTTTTEAPSPFRYATEQDALDIHNANVGDMLLTGANINSDETSIDIRPSFNNTFTLDVCKKILIKGGHYDRIRIEVPGLTGTEECPIIITNYDGQVKCKSFGIVGISHFKLTGKFDEGNQTGDENYQGHVDSYAFTSGKYGFFVSNEWTNPEAFLLSVSGSIYNSVQYQASNWEVEFIESGNGGFSNVFKSDGFTAVMDNVRIHDLYIHDTHGEGIYLGSTGSGNQHAFTNLHVYNNRILRAGNDGLQLGQLSSGCLIENNVIHGAFNWKSPFGEYQDNNVQLQLRNGNITVKNNLFLHGGEKWGNWFINGYSGQTPTGNIEIFNNAFLHCTGPFGIYIGQTTPLSIDNFLIKENWLGKFNFKYDEVYTDSRAINASHVVRYANTTSMEITGNKYDGTGDKTQFLNKSESYVTEHGNELTTVPDVFFINYMGFPDDFDYTKVQQWASKVGDTWGNEDQFGYTGTKKGQAVTYAVNDYVMHKSKLYKCLSANSQKEPEVAAEWATYWEHVSFEISEGQSTNTPPDDVRLEADSTYNLLGIGLLENPAYTGTSTTTSSTTTSTTSTTTTTTTTLGVAPDFTFKTYVKDNGDNTFKLRWGVNRETLTNSPLVVGIGSSTLAGTGATSGNGLGNKIQDFLDQYGGRFINLGRSQYDSSNWSPRGTDINVDNHRNSNAAIMMQPSFAIIVTATNDIISRTPEQALYNIQLIYNHLSENGIVCFIEACQPRTNYTLEQQNNLIHLRDLIISTFPEEVVIDTIPTLKDPESSKPADYKPNYNADGIHMNDLGVSVLSGLITDRVDETIVDSEFVLWEIEKSSNPNTGFALFDTVEDGTIIEKTFSRIDDTEYYFRVRGKRSDNSYGSYTYVSNPLSQTMNRGNVNQTVQIDFSLDTVAAPPEDWNNLNVSSTGAIAGTTFSNLFDIEFNDTGIELEVVQAFSGAGAGGSNTGVYPIRVMQDNWYISTTNKANAVIKLSGLDNEYVYSFDILSSRGSSDTRILGIEANNVFGFSDATTGPDTPNENNVTSLAPIYANEDGEVFIYFSGIAIGHLNSLVIKKYNVIPEGQTTTTTTSSTTTSSTTSSTTTTTTTLAPSSKTIKINIYNGSNPSELTDWNDWNIESVSSPVGYNNLKYADGTDSSINATMSVFENFFDNGSNYTGGLIAPDSVLRNGVFTTNGNLGNTTAMITLSGLNNSKTYSFELIGSRNNTSGNSVLMQVAGTSTVTSSALITDMNKSNSVYVNSITPSSGTITIKIRKSSGSYGYLNALRIFELDGEGTTTTTTTSGGGTSTTTTSTSSTTTTTTTQSTVNPQFLTTIGGWNAYVKLPDDYYTDEEKLHPTIVYFVGRGEVGSDASKILVAGPAKHINEGWNGTVILDGSTVQPIFISMQQAIEFQKPASTINPKIDAILSTYRVDPNRLHLTGFSAGGYCAGIFVTGDTYPGGPYTYANKIASMVSVQGVQPDDNSPYPDVWDNYALSGGKYLGFEQAQDNRNIPTIVNRMNAAVEDSAIYIQTNFGNGGHGYTEYFYGPTATFNINGNTESLYAWMLRQVRTNPTTTTTSSTTSTTTTLAPTTTTTTTGSGTSTTSTTTSSTTSTTTTNAPIVEIAKFNFGPSSGVAVAGWNSVFADPLGGNRSATDSATGIGVLSLGTYNGSTNTAWGQLGNACAVIGGQTTGGNTGVVPDNVLLSYWFNTKNNQTTPARVNGVEINGLEVGGTYTLQFVASRTTGSPSRKCTYDITDANETFTTSPFDAKNNTSALVTVTGRVADISGKIFFGCHGDLSSADQTNDIYGFLNGLIITRTA